MNDKKLKFRIVISTACSLLLHLAAFFFIVQYLHQPKPKHFAGALKVTLAAIPPLKSRIIPEKKILSTHTPAQLKIAQTAAAPRAPAAPLAATQGEAIGGIAMPSAIVTPFSGFNPEENAAFRQHNAQQNAMRAYQEHIMSMQARQQAEREAKFLTQQLQQMLMAIFSDKSTIGNCLIDSGTNTFLCNDENLSKEIGQYENPVMNLLKRLQGLGKNYGGFSVIKTTNSTGIILINERTLTETRQTDK